MIELRLNWLEDILKRMNEVMASYKYTDEEKLEAINWLLKQAKNIDRED